MIQEKEKQEEERRRMRDGEEVENNPFNTKWLVRFSGILRFRVCSPAGAAQQLDTTGLLTVADGCCYITGKTAEYIDCIYSVCQSQQASAGGLICCTQAEHRLRLKKGFSTQMA